MVSSATSAKCGRSRGEVLKILPLSPDFPGIFPTSTKQGIGISYLKFSSVK